MPIARRAVIDQASEINTNTGNFDGVLSGSDTVVQTALETLDEIFNTAQTMTADFTIQKTSAILAIKTTNASDPTLNFSANNGANQALVYLDESSSNDSLVVAGQTASVDTEINIMAQDGEYAYLILYSGANWSAVYVDSADDFIFRNATLDKDIIFRVNDGGVNTVLMQLDGSVSKVLFPAGYAQISTSGATDPTLDFSANNGANQLLVYLDESESIDSLVLAGQTASVDTQLWIQSQDGEDAAIALSSGGTNISYVFVDSVDHFYIRNTVQDKDIVFHINDGAVLTQIMTLDGSESAVVLPEGLLVLNDVSTAITQGILVYQDSGNYTGITFELGSVAHGMTSLANTDTYGWIGGYTSSGALEIDTYSGSDNKAFILYATAGTEDNTHSAAGDGCIVLDAAKKSGTSNTGLTSGYNMVVIRNDGLATAVFAADGDLYLDTAVNQDAWDEYDDIALLSGVRGMSEWIEYAKPILEKTGVVTYNDDGHNFLSIQNLHWLEIDALRQLHGRIAELENQVSLLLQA